MKHRTWLVASMGIAMFIAFGCSNNNNGNQQGKVITLGAVIDQTGSAGPGSWSNAAQLAVTQMNSALVKANSEIRFNLVLSDSTNVPAVAAQRAQDLVMSKGAKGLVVDTSQDDIEILKLQYDADPSKHLDVPLVGLVATSPAINNPNTINPDPVTQAAYQDVGHWNFRTSMSSVPQGRVLTNIAMSKASKPNFKISAFASNEPFGNGQVASLKTAVSLLAPTAIVEAVEFSTTEHTANDADFFSATFAKVIDQHNEETGANDGVPNVWMGLTFPDYLIAIIRASKLAGSTISGVHGMALRNQKIIDSLGSDANGQEGTSYVVVDTSQSGILFASDLMATTGMAPNSMDSATYDAAAVLMLAALAAANGQPDPTTITGAQIRAAMRGTSGAQSPCDFDASGSVTTRLVHFVIENNAFKDMEVYDCVSSPDCPIQM
jgi:ABC-type branched-subunit amino acid transport system substrate-binding protein